RRGIDAHREHIGARARRAAARTGSKVDDEHGDDDAEDDRDNRATRIPTKSFEHLACNLADAPALRKPRLGTFSTEDWINSDTGQTSIFMWMALTGSSQIWSSVTS